MLPVSYDPLLVTASILVAIMASFTGLRLASGLSVLRPAARKPEIARAAIALGGGIWSMHFIGMLAVEVPVQIRYDALSTLGSALVAMLITGVAFANLHFGQRTTQRVVLSGVLMGLGIVTMHFLGMSAIGGNCVVSFVLAGYLISAGIAILSSTCALWLAYKKRDLPQIALGAVVLGIAISGMHYSAMIYTNFDLTAEIVFLGKPALTDGTLALAVAVATFVICGVFLLTAIPTDRFPPALISMPQGRIAESALPSDPARFGSRDQELAMPERAKQAERLPYEINNSTRFIPIDNVSAVRADGHYTLILDGEKELFCPWSISKVEEVLDGGSFLRTHRSFLVNMKRVHGFHRAGDKAFCLIDTDRAVEIPVSRKRVLEVQKALGLK